MKGDNTYVQNQYGQDQAPLNSQAYGQPPQQGYGAVGNMGHPQPQSNYGHHQQQGQSGQPIYVVDQQNHQQSDGMSPFMLNRPRADGREGP